MSRRAAERFDHVFVRRGTKLLSSEMDALKKELGVRDALQRLPSALVRSQSKAHALSIERSGRLPVTPPTSRVVQGNSASSS